MPPCASTWGRRHHSRSGGAAARHSQGADSRFSLRIRRWRVAGVSRGAVECFRRNGIASQPRTKAPVRWLVRWADAAVGWSHARPVGCGCNRRNPFQVSRPTGRAPSTVAERSAACRQAEPRFRLQFRPTDCRVFLRVAWLPGGSMPFRTILRQAKPPGAQPGAAAYRAELLPAERNGGSRRARVARAELALRLDGRPWTGLAGPDRDQRSVIGARRHGSRTGAPE